MPPRSGFLSILSEEQGTRQRAARQTEAPAREQALRLGRFGEGLEEDEGGFAVMLAFENAHQTTGNRFVDFKNPHRGSVCNQKELLGRDEERQSDVVVGGIELFSFRGGRFVGRDHSEVTLAVSREFGDAPNPGGRRLCWGGACKPG